MGLPPHVYTVTAPPRWAYSFTTFCSSFPRMSSEIWSVPRVGKAAVTLAQSFLPVRSLDDCVGLDLKGLSDHACWSSPGKRQAQKSWTVNKMRVWQLPGLQPWRLPCWGCRAKSSQVGTGCRAVLLARPSPGIVIDYFFFFKRQANLGCAFYK